MFVCFSAASAAFFDISCNMFGDGCFLKDQPNPAITQAHFEMVEGKERVTMVAEGETNAWRDREGAMILHTSMPLPPWEMSVQLRLVETSGISNPRHSIGLVAYRAYQAHSMFAFNLGPTTWSDNGGARMRTTKWGRDASVALYSSTNQFYDASVDPFSFAWYRLTMDAEGEVRAAYHTDSADSGTPPADGWQTSSEPGGWYARFKDDYYPNRVGLMQKTNTLHRSPSMTAP